MQEELEKNAMTLSETQRRAKEREFGELNRDFQRKQREFREDLNQRRNQELAQVVEQANRVIRQIAEQEKFDIIFQEMPAYVSPRIDITDRVIKALEGKPPRSDAVIAWPGRSRWGRSCRASAAGWSATPRLLIRQVGSLERAAAGQITFLSDSKHAASLAATRAAAVIVAPENEKLTKLPRIVCDAPYAYFAKVSQLFNPAVVQASGRASVGRGCQEREAGQERIHRRGLRRRRWRDHRRRHLPVSTRRHLSGMFAGKAGDPAFRRGDRRRRLRHRAARRAAGSRSRRSARCASATTSRSAPIPRSTAARSTTR